MQGRATRAFSITLAVSVSAALLGLQGCGEGAVEVSNGSIQIQTQTTTATAESSLDTDGYTVVMDGSTTLTVDSDGSVTLDQVPAGEHVVELDALQDNCTTPSSPANVTVESGAVAQVSFAVTCWPPPSGRIVFSRTVDHPVLGLASHIYVMDADGTDRQQLTDVEGFDSQPVWSPDNQKIAFAFVGTGLVGFSSDIYVMNADGTGRTNLTWWSASDDTSPAWSPDGSKIAFSRNVDDDLGIYVMNADGSDVVQLMDGGSDPAWSPDGSRIAFNCDLDVCVMNSDGSGTVNLTNTHTRGEWVFAGSWSPDGQKILFDAEDLSLHTDIYVMNADGSNSVCLTRVRSVEGGGSWSPDGTKIAFTVQGLTGGSIYYMNADGTGRVSLTEDMEPGVWSSQRAPSWSHGS